MWWVLIGHWRHGARKVAWNYRWAWNVYHLLVMGLAPCVGMQPAFNQWKVILVILKISQVGVWDISSAWSMAHARARNYLAILHTWNAIEAKAFYTMSTGLNWAQMWLSKLNWWVNNVSDNHAYGPGWQRPIMHHSSLWLIRGFLSDNSQWYFHRGIFLQSLPSHLCLKHTNKKIQAFM